MRIARVFFDVHMGKNFDGLLQICRTYKMKQEQNPESYVVFINAAKTKFKLLVGNQYIVYHDNGNKKIPLEAIQFLPSAFTGEKFDFSQSVERAMRKKLKPSALFTPPPPLPHPQKHETPVHGSV